MRPPMKKGSSMRASRLALSLVLTVLIVAPAGAAVRLPAYTKTQLKNGLQKMPPFLLRYVSQPLCAILRRTSKPLMAKGDAKRKSAYCSVQAFV